MKSIYALIAVSVMTAGIASAQGATARAACAANQASNAVVIARAQAAATADERQAILQAAIDANPANAVCLADLALQMSLTNIDPAAGPEEFGNAEVATTTDGTTPPAENASQLNQNSGTDSASPAVPAL